jgi:hypothetical protein
MNCNYMIANNARAYKHYIILIFITFAHFFCDRIIEWWYLTWPSSHFSTDLHSRKFTASVQLKHCKESKRKTRKTLMQSIKGDAKII